MIYFTSDHHFGHGRILKHCPNRQYPDGEAMNSDYIRRWNARVGVSDTVYHLGDLSLHGFEYVKGILGQLNGGLQIVSGGHDKRWLREMPAHYLTGLTLLPPLYHLHVSLGGKDQRIVLCHYPLEEWEGSYRGSWHLHGHTHGRLRSLPGRLDVGVDPYPDLISLEELRACLTRET